MPPGVVSTQPAAAGGDSAPCSLHGPSSIDVVPATPGASLLVEPDGAGEAFAVVLTSPFSSGDSLSSVELPATAQGSNVHGKAQLRLGPSAGGSTQGLFLGHRDLALQNRRSVVTVSRLLRHGLLLPVLLTPPLRRL